MKRKRQILIAEDEAVNRLVLRKILEDEYEVSEVSNGADALRVLKETPGAFAAVILDLVMPGMSGFEVLTKISKVPELSNLPILVATGAGSLDSEVQSFAAGAWDYVTKPYNPVILRYRLRNIIARSQMPLLERVRVLAQQDQLTGLYNRRFFMQVAGDLIAENPDTQFVLIRMDVDRFRLYNASFGSQAGDDLLRRIADKLRDIMGPLDRCVYGRIESDIFCICVPYKEEPVLEDIQAAARIGRELCTDYCLELSFGLYVLPGPDTDLERAYSCTVSAAAKCKDNYNRSYAFYDNAMEEKERKNQRITNEMERALKERQFHVYLQPKYSLKSDRPCGAEALVRWERPDKGMVMPGDFIPLFEQNGFILQLDYYMWESVCALLQKWRNQGQTPAPISVNVSRVSLFSPDIIEKLTGLVKKYDIPVELLNLEITESTYMANPSFMSNVIEELHACGFVILMDDFGSGYSSLNTLKNIDVDILKMDLRFLPTGERNVKSEKILASVVRMAGWLGTPVVVEGVETQEQRDFLESIGCIYVQGYFYAKPMPQQEYEALMERTALLEDSLGQESGGEVCPDALWSSDKQITELLREISAPFVLYEYSEGQIDVLRMNDEYMRTFFTDNTKRLLSATEYSKLKSAMEQCIRSRGTAECECMFLIQNGVSRWFQIRLHYIATTAKVSLLSGTFKDVSVEKRLEFSMVRLFGKIDSTEETPEELLIIDDSAVSREILGKMFEERFHILFAENGEEGLRVLREHQARISLVLLDLIMPVMDGKQFLREKNNLPDCAEVPVIVISVNDDDAYQTDLLSYGISDYITKPFSPEVVKKRVSNVLDYRKRFQKTVRDYQGQLLISESEKLVLQEERAYSPTEIRQMLALLSGVFDIVRVVSPEESATLLFCEDGTVEKIPQTCYQVWKRDKRCENCTSICALHRSQMETKLEHLDDETYYVVSKPIILALPGQADQCYVLEIVNRISHSLLVKGPEKRPLRALLEDTRRKMYTDELTGAYNRRYLHELLFEGENQLHHPPLGIILMDLRDFKTVNDTWGHRVGDQVLCQVTKAILSQVRETDPVIRSGGDEFIIALLNCGREQVEQAMERISAAVDGLQGLPQPVHADMGCSYTDSIRSETQFLELMEEADRNMYCAKRENEDASGPQN